MAQVSLAKVKGDSSSGGQFFWKSGSALQLRVMTVFPLKALEEMVKVHKFFTPGVSPISISHPQQLACILLISSLYSQLKVFSTRTL